MTQIMRKPGWILNPEDRVVNAIIKRIELNGGLCPCYSEGPMMDRLCPCKEYRENDICHCTLYVKEDECKDKEA